MFGHVYKKPSDGWTNFGGPSLGRFPVCGQLGDGVVRFCPELQSSGARAHAKCLGSCREVAGPGRFRAKNSVPPALIRRLHRAALRRSLAGSRSRRPAGRSWWVLDGCAGFQSVAGALAGLAVVVVSVDQEDSLFVGPEVFYTDIRADLRESSFLDCIVAASRTMDLDLVWVWFSPPCFTYSTLNATNGTHRRTSAVGKPPLPGPAGDEARACDELVRRRFAELVNLEARTALG
jgi:hypothetical protein